MIQLKTIPLSSLVNWSVQYLLDATFSYNQKFDLVPIGKFLTRNKTAIEIEDGVIYKRVTIKINNGGIYLRNEEDGKNIGTKKQFLVQKNQFLMSKIDARNGAFGVVPDELDNAIITGNFWTFDVDTNLINPYFLSLIVTTPEFIKFCQNASNGSTNRHYLQEDLFLAQPIPLPSIPEQKRIVDQYKSKVKLAETQLKEAKELENNIESFMANSLGLTPLQSKSNKKGLQFIEYKNFDRWDILAKDMRILNGLLTTPFNLKRIGEAYTFAKRSWNKKNHITDSFKYIELGAIDTINGVSSVKEVQVRKAPSRATQKVHKGDLIIGTTRPYLKRFAIIDEKNDKDICSSGFAILEPTQTTDLNFLKEFLMSYYGIEQLKNRMTGATYPAITSSELKEILVPLPRIEEQKKISNKVSEMRSQIKKLQKKSNSNFEIALKEFEQEIFSN